MLQLTLMRHAHALHDGYNDLDRALSPRGEEQASDAGKRLLLSPPQVILVSPSKRTMQTASAICEQNNKIQLIQEPAIYTGTALQLLDLVKLCDVYGINHVLLLGHNPTISELLFIMQLDEADFITMHPAEYHTLNFDLASWGELTPACAEISQEGQ